LVTFSEGKVRHGDGLCLLLLWASTPIKQGPKPSFLRF